MSTLTLDQIEDILSNTRDRGGTEREIRKFASSGELAVDVMTLAGFGGKNADSVYNSFNTKAKALRAADSNFPELKAVKPKVEEGEPQPVILINLDVHRKMQAEANEAA